MPLHALELLLDDASDAWVRADWTSLRQAGLPSMADHRSATNRPHTTVVAAPGLDESVEAAARELLLPLLPLTLWTTGTATFAEDPVVLVRPLAVPADVLEVVERIRGLADARPQGPWVGHVTLARRIPRDRLDTALAVVQQADTHPLVFPRLRRWDPDRHQTTPVEQRQGPSPGSL